MSRTSAQAPSDLQLIVALRTVARTLGTDVAYVYDGRFHFPLGDNWTFALCADFGPRFRLELWRGLRRVGRLWCLAVDQGRIEELARDAAGQVDALKT